MDQSCQPRFSHRLPLIHIFPAVKYFPPHGLFLHPTSFLAQLDSTRFPSPTQHPLIFVHSFTFLNHFAMCSYTSSFLAGISYSIWLILSATTFGFEDFSLVVFVDFFYSAFASFMRIRYSFMPNVFCFSRAYSFSHLM